MNARALCAAAFLVATTLISAMPATASETDVKADVLSGGDGTATLQGGTNPMMAFEPIELTEEVPWTDAWLDALEMPDSDDTASMKCLSEALYFEARGEPVRGQFAVAEVILNRVVSREFPDDVCAVVNQGTGERFRCQFSYTCDGLPEVVSDRRAWSRSEKIAALALTNGVPLNLTEGAMYYHTKAVSPYWADLFDMTTEIGAHRFYNSEEWSRRS